MHDIHITSFVFGAFCMACMVIAYYFGRRAVGDGECCEFDEDEADEVVNNENWVD